jgi:hypothetical protein
MEAEMFYLFLGDDYYPSGGVYDLKGKYSSVQEAKDALLKIEYFDWWHITDSDMNIVEKG